MKTVRCVRPDLSVAVPVRGGTTVKFTGHLSTVPDEVADTLCAMAPAHFRIVAAEIKQGARVLVIRDLALGDVLMTTPLLRALKARYKAVVDVAVHPTVLPALLHNPHVDSVLAVNQLDRRTDAPYDAVIDLNMVVENAESQGVHEHRVKAFGHVADIDLVTAADLHLDYFVTDQEKADARETARPLSGKTVAYVWRASMDNRSWDADQHKSVLSTLSARGLRCVVLHHTRVEHPFLYELPGIVNLTGQTTLRETAAIISICDACVTPDTGAYHLAAALDVPAVAYFGAMAASERTTHTVPLEVLNREGVCGLLPCRQYRCLHPEKSAGGMPPCIAVSPGDVTAAAGRVLLATASGGRKKIAPRASRTKTRLDLSGVTLLAATGRDHGATLAALAHCRRLATFANVVYFSDIDPKDRGIEWIKIEPFAKWEDLSVWGLTQFPEHRARFSGHALAVQWDGYIVNPDAWDPEFLETDFVGAPWPDGVVGNNGFCLMSQSYLAAVERLGLPETIDACHPSDAVVGRTRRADMEAQGVKFAAQDLAARFSSECVPWNGAFGFHGALAGQSIPFPFPLAPVGINPSMKPEER